MKTVYCGQEKKANDLKTEGSNSWALTKPMILLSSDHNKKDDLDKVDKSNDFLLKD